MPITCPQCNKAHSVDSLSSDFSLVCSCGAFISFDDDPAYKQLLEVALSEAIEVESNKIDEIRVCADLIRDQIVNSQLSLVDIEIQQERLQRLIDEYFPDKGHLYDLLYRPRFARLWEQFRDNK